MHKKDEKQFDALNKAIVYSIMAEMEEKYVGKSLQLSTVVGYISSKNETTEFINYFETDFEKGADKVVYPIYYSLLEELVANIDRGLNKYRKFRRMIDRMGTVVEEVRDTYNMYIPINVILLDSFLCYTLLGAEDLAKETRVEESEMGKAMEHVIKAFICLFYLTSIKGATKKRDSVELIATQLLIVKASDEPVSVIDVVFDLLQEGFY